MVFFFFLMVGRDVKCAVGLVLKYNTLFESVRYENDQGYLI